MSLTPDQVKCCCCLFMPLLILHSHCCEWKKKFDVFLCCLQDLKLLLINEMIADSSSYCSFSPNYANTAFEEITVQLSISNWSSSLWVLVLDKTFPEMLQEFKCSTSYKEHNCLLSKWVSDTTCSGNDTDFTTSFPREQWPLMVYQVTLKALATSDDLAH